MQLIAALTIFSVGILCTVILRGEPFRALSSLRGGSASSGEISPFAALTSALCGTLGVGSIGAVTAALSQGGAGVLIWLWLGAIMGCSLKYAEVRITMAHKSGALSGAMVALHEKSPLLGCMYALLCLPVALLGMGNLTQAQVLSDTLHAASLPRPIIAFSVLVILTLLLSGGIRRIGRVSAVVLPAVGTVYIAICLYAIFLHRENLPLLLNDLLAEAHHPNPALFALGIARGLFISEAGMGTAAFAHSRSGAPPRLQGALGVCEVLFSTLLATLTALAVLLTGVPLQADAALHAFRAVLGSAGDVLLCLMITFFALSTLPVWWFYGQQCVRFLSGKRIFSWVFTTAFLCIACLGCIFSFESAWRIADAANLALTLPALLMLLLYRRELVAILPNRAKKVILKSNRKSSFYR